MTKTPRVRFAPSPTGKLHIGGARTAIYNWAFARAHGGTFILRIDDTDPERSTQENVDIIIRAMKWLGLDWDEGPDKGGSFGPYYQTQRLDTYTDALDKLIESGNAYPCFCTTEELEQARNGAKTRGDSFQGYQRTCRDIDPAQAKARIEAGENHVWRIKVPDDTKVEFHDCVHGDMSFNSNELDDFVIMRSDGTPTYNFATVIDDALMEITHIIRGDDHLSNTPRQVVVYEALGCPVPEFAHISMILGADGKKLSKRHGATSVEEYRDQGLLSDAFVNYLALLGWSLDGETTIISRETLAKEFSLERISKNPAVFDPEKLAWMNAEYLKSMEPADFAQKIIEPALIEAGIVEAGAYDANPQWYQKLALIIRERTKTTLEVAGKVAFLFEGEDVTMDEKSVTKNIAKEGTLVILKAAYKALEALDNDAWNTENIDSALAVLPESLEVNKRKFYAPIRVAECGNQVSPPLGESIELLGRDVALKRLENAFKLAL